MSVLYTRRPSTFATRQEYWADLIACNMVTYQGDPQAHVIANMADYAATAETIGLKTCAWHAISLAHKSKCHCANCKGAIGHDGIPQF